MLSIGNFASSIRGAAMAVCLMGLGLGLGTGCSSQGYEKADVASKRMVDVQKDVGTVKEKISNAVTTLNDLVSAPKPDLKPQYVAFSNAVNDLDKMAQKTRDRATDMKANREAYVAKWTEEANALQNPEMKERAMKRLADVKSTFEKLGTQGEAVKAAFAPYMADLKDLQHYLGSDLTPAGIKSITDLAAKTTREEAEVQKALNSFIAELDKVSAEISPSGGAK